MATAKTGPKGGRRSWKGWALAGLAVTGAGLWWNGDAISGQAAAGTAYGARTACSCRHLGGRDLASCKGDFIPGMGLVFLSEDESEKSVTATVPLVASDTARFREGFGCVLDSWED
jgi:hypothetical protein